ncbi:MAG: DUF5906 domain-containing protein [Bacteroidota bacterium]|nr:DUF5906 domain-containing protein [Bacteroidota bacterium]
MSNSYLNKRLLELGISDAENTTLIKYFDADSETELQKDCQWLQTYDPSKSDLPDKGLLDGAIAILHKNLENHQYRYKANGEGWSKDYFLYRLHPDNVIGGAKYFQSFGSPVIPFFSQCIIDAYLAKQKLERIYLVEGPIKAFALWVFAKRIGIDLPIIGISGIHQFGHKDKYSHDSYKPIYLKEDIVELINVCMPDKAVLILDADLRDFPVNKTEAWNQKDLAQRFNSFFAAVNNFNSCLSPFVKQVYMVHPKERYLDKKINQQTVKGIDDLFMYENKLHTELFKDLGQLSQATSYFDGIRLDNTSVKKVKEYFYLSDIGTFYERFKFILKEDTFTWQFQQYQFANGKLARLLTGNEKLFLRIGTRYYKISHKVNADGSFEKCIIEWSRETILEDYPKRDYPEFWAQIQCFDNFCNIPENDPDKFKPVSIHPSGTKFYNRYIQLEHDYESGSWDAIEAFLRHLFREQYDVILDYIYLLYHKPIEQLPIICLVSQDRNTGKSTFLKFMHLIFQGNVRLIGNHEMNDSFNADFIDKLIIAIDEAILEKQAVIEKIKSLATCSSTSIHSKFRDRTEGSFFGKFIITSNKEFDFIRIDSDETRFWIRKVSPLDSIDPDMIKKLKTELPGFLNYIRYKHKLKYQKTTRHWFAYNLYHTSASQKLKDRSVPAYLKGINEFLKDEFLKTKTNLLSFNISDLQNNLDAPEYKFSKEQILVKKLMDDHVLSGKAYKTGKNAVSRLSYTIVDNDGIENANWLILSAGRYYDFYFEDWLTSEECHEIYINKAFKDHIGELENTKSNKIIYLDPIITERWQKYVGANGPRL